MPAGGLAALPEPGSAPIEVTDPLLSGQVMAIFVITIAAAEIGVALAIVLLLFRARQTADLTEVEELGEASPTYTENIGAAIGSSVSLTSSISSSGVSLPAAAETVGGSK
jgi:hypothetical protein